jgi:hypothetical protein
MDSLRQDGCAPLTAPQCQEAQLPVVDGDFGYWRLDAKSVHPFLIALDNFDCKLSVVVIAADTQQGKRI